MGALGIPNWLVVNCPVIVLPDRSPGTVRYVGSTEFACGIWVGIELDSPNGKKVFLKISFVLIFWASNALYRPQKTHWGGLSLEGYP